MKIEYCEVSCSLEEILRLKKELSAEEGLIAVVESGGMKWKLAEMDLIGESAEREFLKFQKELVEKIGEKNENGQYFIKRLQEGSNDTLTEPFKEYETRINELLEIEKNYKFPIITIEEIEKLNFKGYPKAFFSIIKRCNQ